MSLGFRVWAFIDWFFKSREEFEFYRSSEFFFLSKLGSCCFFILFLLAAGVWSSKAESSSEIIELLCSPSWSRLFSLWSTLEIVMSEVISIFFVTYFIESLEVPRYIYFRLLFASFFWSGIDPLCLDEFVFSPLLYVDYSLRWASEMSTCFLDRPVPYFR